MGKRKIIRCAACARRIRDHHPYFGLEDYETGREIAYHARPDCQRAAAEQLHARMARGRLYLLHHYHVCDDEANGYGCAGGCFSGMAVLGRN